MAPPHMRDHRLGPVERTAQIYRDHPVPIGHRHRRNRLAGNRAGRIDQHVDAAGCGRDVVSEGGEGGAVGDIEGVAGCRAADLGGNASRRPAIAVDHRDPRPGGGKRPG